MLRSKANVKSLAPSVVVALTLFGASYTVTDSLFLTNLLLPIAHADTTGSAGKGQQGPVDKGQGSKGQRGTMGAAGQGQGGPSSDSDAKGPRYGGGGAAPAPGSRGGKPVWAQEGVPSDLELGRLNVVRAPTHVIDRALNEALLNLDPSLYSLPDLNAVLLAILNGTYPRIDSPLENLGLYRDLLSDGAIGDGTKITVTDDNFMLLAAIFLGSASDKVLEVSEGTVDAVDKILGLELPSSVSVTDLADAADQVRLAILKAHDS